MLSCIFLSAILYVLFLFPCDCPLVMCAGGMIPKYTSPAGTGSDARATSSSIPAKPTKAPITGVLQQRVGKYGKKRVYQDAVVPQETRESVVEKDVAEEGF